MEIRIKLNPDNEKDKLIIEMLKGEYITPSQFIKNMLYKIAFNSLPIPKSGMEVAKSPQQSLKVDSEWSKYF